MSSKKRKFRGRKVQSDSIYDRHEERKPDPELFIQAYEADVVQGASEAKTAVDALGTFSGGGGSGLILWGTSRQELPPGETTSAANILDSADAHATSPVMVPSIWLDRFDARLLLDQLPPGTSSPGTSSQKTSRRDVSPSGWSDLPSDSEDTFFLEPSEIEAYTRDKRRRTLDRDREARLRAIQDQEGPRKVDEEIWGGSDEEPEEEQKELMNRTAKHLVSSPNPAQLEMRILANHGSDKRFAFLRGRWKLSWKIAMSKARQEQKSQEDAQKVAQTSTGLGGLSGYGDSDSEESASVEKAPSVRPLDLKDGDDNGDGSKGVTEQKIEALKEARRARAKEWARSRREDKTGPM